MTEERLAMAARHVREGQERVIRQRLLVERLRNPEQIEIGRRVLATMEQSLALAERSLLTV